MVWEVEYLDFSFDFFFRDLFSDFGIVILFLSFNVFIFKIELIFVLLILLDCYKDIYLI